MYLLLLFLLLLTGFLSANAISRRLTTANVHDSRQMSPPPRRARPAPRAASPPR
ncbi:hypothetical protein ACFW04_010772 [Cataglyphis niger]